MTLEIKKNILPGIDGNNIIKPTAIILHWWGEESGTEGIEWLCRTLQTRQLSVQFAVLKDGQIYQLSPTADTYCRHAKCANSSSIGIEIEGKNAADLDANEVQFKSVLKLVQFLKKQYSISSRFAVVKERDCLRFFGIASHKQVDGYCPDASGKIDVHDEYVSRVRALAD